MSIEITNQSDDSANFTMRGVNTRTANALRRAVMSHIPTVAMRGFPDADSTIHIEVNTSPFNNEILKQRLQCVPVHLTDRSVDLEKYTVRLDVTATDGLRSVTTGDITMTWGPEHTPVPEKTVRALFPADPITGDHILITRLNPAIPGVAAAEQLTLTAELYWTDGSVEGTASAASTCSYAASPDLEKQTAAWSELAPSSANPERDRIDFLLGPGARIIIPDSFDWIIETVGVYAPMQLLGIACDYVLGDLAMNVSTLSDEGRITPHVSAGATNAYNVRITGDEYAVGYLLQSAIYDAHCAAKPTNFVGFRKDHPHDSHATLRLAIDEAATPDLVAAVVTAAASTAATAITAIKTASA